jgi:hypothetical protein
MWVQVATKDCPSSIAIGAHKTNKSKNQTLIQQLGLASIKWYHHNLWIDQTWTTPQELIYHQSKNVMDSQIKRGWILNSKAL